MTVKKAPKTLAAFREEFDPNIRVPAAIRAALDKLRAEDGAEAWEYEVDFTRRCGIGNGQMSAFRDMFAKHIAVGRTRGSAEKRCWFADPKVAAKARGD